MGLHTERLTFGTLMTLKRLLGTAGGCNGGDNILCAVDCDGGSVTLDKMPPANGFIVRLNNEAASRCFTTVMRGKAPWW